MQVGDDLYLGNFVGPQGLSLLTTAGENPTAQIGVGPAGRIFFMNIVPLTKQAANVAALQHMTQGTGLTLAAGTGATLGTAPDGSGSPVIVFDTPRCVSLTSTADLHLINYTVTGYDYRGVKMSQVKAGPNNSTVTTLKAFKSVLSIVPGTTDGTNNVSAGSADIFGLSLAVPHIEYVVAAKWAGALADDAGTFVVADTTSPATTATGDVRGTYAPSSASDGSKRLVLAFHLDATQVGSNPTVAAAVGVTQV